MILCYILGLGRVRPDEAELFVYGKGDADPDDEKSDKTVEVKGFVEVKQPQKKLERGIDIHQDTRKIVGYFLYSDIEKQQRNGSDDATEGKQNQRRSVENAVTA